MPFSSRAEGREMKRGGKRERATEASEEHSDFQRVDKEAPSMQIKCCFHNHSSVPLSEVRFFVIKVKGTFTRGRVRSFAPINQPANQPTNPAAQPPTRPTTAHPQTTLLISITENSAARFLCVPLIKRFPFFLSIWISSSPSPSPSLSLFFCRHL